MEMKKINELIHKTPDVREDIVANLRTQILGETYEVKAEQAAEGIMRYGIYVHGAWKAKWHKF